MNQLSFIIYPMNDVNAEAIPATNCLMVMERWSWRGLVREASMRHGVRGIHVVHGIQGRDTLVVCARPSIPILLGAICEQWPTSPTSPTYHRR